METDFSSERGMLMSPSPDTVDDASGTASNLMQPRIDYFLPNMSENEWQSNYNFNQAGMQIVYTISNLTLDAIFPKYDQYLGYALNYEDFTDFSKVNITSMLWDNKGPAGFLAGGSLFVVLFTLFGIGWCFVKCFCGDKGCCVTDKDSEDRLAKKLEQKRDKCKRASCGILFATLIVVFMFGLVCCFVTNEQMKTSIKQMPQDLDNSLADTDTYFSTTKKQINALFKDNYDLLRATLNHILDQSGEIIKNGLSRKTGAQALNNLTDIVRTVEEVRANVLSVEKASKNLKENADKLQVGLTGSKKRLLEILQRCQSAKCQDLNNTPEIRSLRVQNDFQNLPDMTDILRELGTFLSTDLNNSIEEGKKAFNELGIRIKNEIEPVLPEIRAVIDETGKELAAIAKSLTDVVDSVPVNQSREKMTDIEMIMKEYVVTYGYYATLGVCVTLAFIFTLLTLGIFIGFCGKQPGSEYSNECCSRKTGSSFINCGIFFMFLTGWILMIVAMTLFLGSGGLSQVVCESIQNMDNRTEDAFRLPKLRVQSKYNYKVPPFNEIIRDCKEGVSAYHAFQISSVYDIENITYLADRFKKKARRLANQISLPNDATEGIVFLSPEAKEQLTRFSSSKISKVKFDRFAEQLDDSILSVDLNEVIRRLNATVSETDDPDMHYEMKNHLSVEILILQSYQKDYVVPMIRDVKNCSTSLRSLSQQQKDLSLRIVNVAEAAEKAQDSLRNSGATKQVKELAKEFETEFVRHVEDYANFTYIGIRDYVGQCGPLYNAVNSTVNTFCHKIGSPLSGFWFSLTCLLLLFFPLTIIGIILARLYSKYKSVGYESETYYSAYGDGDTIPLSLSANVRRHKRGREPSHSAAARFPSRFEDTSQNSTEFGIVGEEPGPSSSSRAPEARFNLHFVDSSHEPLLNAGSSRVETDFEQPPPPYSAAVSMIPAVSLSSSRSSSMHEAWGSQLVFSNHHTPPASGEYERPPPYYYPGPAQ